MGGSGKGEGGGGTWRSMGGKLDGWKEGKGRRGGATEFVMSQMQNGNMKGMDGTVLSSPQSYYITARSIHPGLCASLSNQKRGGVVKHGDKVCVV